MRSSLMFSVALLLGAVGAAPGSKAADDGLTCREQPAVAVPAADLLAIEDEQPFPIGTPEPALKLCYWALYDEYYDASGNMCGYRNTCSGEWQPCNWTSRTTEWLYCC